MDRIEVHKFGGTSVGSAERIQHAAQLIKHALEGTRLVVVSSAMTGITNQLVAAAAAAETGERTRGLELIYEVLSRHKKALSAISDKPHEAIHARLERMTEQLAELIRASVLLGELTPRTRDRILAAGEKFSVLLVEAALEEAGVSAKALYADTFLETDDQFGEANPLLGVADRTIRAALVPHLEVGRVPVVTGYCGRAPDGATTTLGRGGSDFSATLIAGALNADGVTIWTDVDGVYSADPRVVPEARVVRQLHFREAAEMSYYGAKVLHQRTMIPVAQKGIPVTTRNSFNLAAPGTVVDRRFTPGSHPVKGISAVRGQALVSIEGKGMSGVPGVAARVFGALAARKISVTMICQSSSESSICLALPVSDALVAESALKRELRPELSRGDVEEIVVRRKVGLVAAVGLGMAHHPGVSGRLFVALGRRRVNVLAIAQGSSELNISLAIEERDIEDALRGIHEAFGLHLLDTGEDSARGLDLLLLGTGRIGRALVELVRHREAHVFERFGLTPRIVALSDRSGYVLSPSGLSDAELDAVLSHKTSGKALSEMDDGVAAEQPAEMVSAALEYRLARPVLVDVTDADVAYDAYLEAFRLGADVVTANKKPMAGSYEGYRKLRSAVSENARLLKAEATVGAGLPVLDTLENLLHAGDVLRSAEGLLSGTLGFLMSRLEEGKLLSEAVREAVELGYTEPDPVADLSGADVMRKAVILGRLSGLASASTPVALEGLVPDALAGMEHEALFAALAERFDAPLAERVEAARAEGKKLRYVARVEAGKITVGPRPVSADSAMGQLKGTDNMIVFTTDRYAERPLVVTGPGAGIDVTAMGVLGDILRVAAERR